MGRVDSKIALVTGGAAGIGRSASILLAREGAWVAVTDVRDDDGRRLVREIEAGGGQASY